MADEMLEIGARVDTSAIPSGMQQNAQATQQAAQQMSGAFAQVTQSSTASAAAQRTVTQATQQSAQAMSQTTNATAAAVTQTRQLAQANLQLAAASHQAVTGQQATSAAIRALEGNAGLRAVENFIAKTLGLGPAMQAIFPIVGGLAFGKIIFDMGEKLVEVEQKAVHAKDAIGDAFGALHEKAVVANDDLAITAARLQIEIDKLEGHPQNGLALALAEGKKYGDDLLVTLRADRTELEALLKEHNVGFFGQALSGVASTGAQQKNLIADQRQLADTVAQANTAYNVEAASAKGDEQIKAAAAKRDKAIHEAVQTQIDSYRREETRLKQEEANSVTYNAKTGLSEGPQTDNSAKIAEIQGRTNELLEIQTGADMRANISRLTAQKEADTQAKELAAQQKENARKAVEAAKQAAEQHYRQFEEELAQRQIEGPMTAKAIYDYWDAARNAFQVGSTQYVEIVRRQAQIAAEGARQFHTEIEKLKKEQTKQGAEDATFATEQQMRMSKATEDAANNALQAGPKWEAYNKELARSAEISANTTAELAMVSIRTREANGTLSAVGALQAEAAVRATQHAAALKALREELAKLQAQAKAEGSVNILGQVTDPKLAGQIQGVTNQIQQQEGQGQVQGAQDQAAIARAKAAPYNAATMQISSGLSSALGTWERGQQSFGQAWTRTLGGMVMQLQGHVVQMTAMWAAHYAEQRLLHLTTNAVKAGSDTAAAATAVATSKAQTAQEGTNAAVAAFKHTYASTSAIPVIGPFLAPVAASAAFVAVEAFSAERGFDQVPADNTLVNLHKNEMVLPADLAGRVRGMTGDGRGLTQNFGGNTFHGNGSSFPQMLDDHEDALASKMMQLHRDGKLG